MDDMSVAQLMKGPAKHVLDTFKIKVNIMADQSKLCDIIFDELAIKENVTYNPEHDEVKDFGGIDNLNI